jgi:post-segregation antitoxin (ccd killing protein)
VFKERSQPTDLNIGNITESNMKTVSIKVPEEMYQEMKMLNLNWSEEIRKEIENRIKKEKRKRHSRIF